MSAHYRKLLIVGLVIFALSLFSFPFAPLPTASAGLGGASANCSGDDLVVSWWGSSFMFGIPLGVTISGDGPGLPAFGPGPDGSVTLPGPATWTGVTVRNEGVWPVEPGTSIPLGDFTCSTAPPHDDSQATTVEPAAGPPFRPGDNRLNPDPAAPVAVYCRADGIHIYNIDRTGRGGLAFIASYNQINAVGIPSVNTLIASGGGVGLFRLTSGEFQVNSTRASSSQSRRTPLQQQDSGQTIHVVQRGDNLFRLALRYGTTIDAIAAANGIVDVTRIFVGQRLVIPVGSTPPGTLPGTTGVNVPAPSSAGIGSGYVFIFNGC